MSYVRGLDTTRRGQHVSHPVLIVDDYADSRATLREMVEELGQEVVEAQDGQEALNFLVSNPQIKVQLILLDLDMPGMSGWQLLTLLKNYVGLASIPVVVVSRHASRLGPREQRLLAGSFEAPQSFPQLRSMVEAIVAH
jgi:CheY-like chemotaxis protein